MDVLPEVGERNGNQRGANALRTDVRVVRGMHEENMTHSERVGKHPPTTRGTALSSRFRAMWDESLIADDDDARAVESER